MARKQKGAAMSARRVAAWGGHEPPRPHAGTGSPQGLPFARSAANLLFASEVIQMDGVPTSPSGIGMSETVTAHARLRDASARQAVRMGSESEDLSRGGPAARSPRRQDFGGQATLSPDNGKREGSQESQQNRAFSSLPRASRGRPRASRGRSAEGETAFIPILPADIAAGQSPDSVFHFLGSKTDPILHVSYPSPWNVVADFAARRGENRRNQNWRCLLTSVGTAILGVQYK